MQQQANERQPQGNFTPPAVGERQIGAFQLSPETSVRVLLTGPAPTAKEIRNLIRFLEIHKEMLEGGEGE